jgi:hypothetical protein
VRFTDPPIIIGGCGRSGTTLVASILSCHPRVAVVGPETRAFAAGAYPSDLPPRPFTRFRWPALLAELQRARPGAVRWCEKTPRNVHAFAHLQAAFEGRVRLIHVVRDGRDVVCSFHPRDPLQPWISPERWVEDVRAGLEAAATCPVHVVRYEDLATRFEPTVRALAEFIGEPDPAPMLAYPAGATLVDHAAWAEPARPVSAASVGRWRDPACAPYVEALMAHPEAPGLLAALGYAAPATRKVWSDPLETVPRPAWWTRAGRATLTRRSQVRPLGLAPKAERLLARLPASAPAPAPNARPIFVLGPPCSGVETVAGLLRAHPDLYVLPADARILARSAAGAVPEAYRRVLRAAGAPPDARWVDPAPDNLPRARELRATFPEARFLVVTRAPARALPGLAARMGWRRGAERRLAAASAMAAAVAAWPEAMAVEDARLRARPQETLQHVLRFLGLPWAPGLDEALARHAAHLARGGPW